MAFELITGRAGRDHVTSDDIGVQNALLFGSGRYVLDELKAQVVDSNTLHIDTFSALVDGRYFRCSGEGVELKISNGTQNRSRIDLVVMRYELQVNGGDFVEEGSIAVIEGEQVIGDATPVEPTCAGGSILDGDHFVEIPLFSVRLNGTEVVFEGDYRIESYSLPIALGGTGANDAPSALENLGAASEDHEHDADDIKTGTLPVARGGTGKTALVGATSLLRDLFDANITDAGYIPVFTSNWADGGYMTPQNLRNKMGLGNTTGALPVSNGGTGAASAADACKNLGVIKTETSGSWKIYTIAGSLKVQCFYATASFTGGNTRVRFSRLNFPKAYASAPVVSATLKSDSNSAVELSCHAKVHEVGSGYVEVAACSGTLDLASPINFKVFVIAIGV